MRRAVIAVTALGIAAGASACSTSGAHHGAHTAPGTWTVASCRVDVTYIDATNTVENYIPDTDANFQQHYVRSKLSGAAGMAVVITFVNNTGRQAPLPADLVVSFTDGSGNAVGHPQTVNNSDGTGYGPAVADGRGSGETFSASTTFNPGWTVAEAPDIGPSVPRRPDLKCQVS